MRKKEEVSTATVNFLWALVAIVSLLLAFSGAMLNIFVIASNDGLMPVKTSRFIHDGEHFAFQENSEVRQAKFADIYRISGINKKVDGWYSLGDFVIFLGSLFCFVSLIIQIKLIAEFAKKEESL